MAEKEPTVKEVANAVLRIMEAEDFEKEAIDDAVAHITECETSEEAIGDAFTILAECGIEPDAAHGRLVAEGILE